MIATLPPRKSMLKVWTTSWWEGKVDPYMRVVLPLRKNNKLSYFFAREVCRETDMNRASYRLLSVPKLEVKWEYYGFLFVLPLQTFCTLLGALLAALPSPPRPNVALIFCSQCGTGAT